jgi:membrane protein implicated in regulation of membrane protease activity
MEIMCHLALLLPVFGLAVFWIWPMSIAIPVYIFILVISGLLYYTLMKVMNEPVKTGRKGLIGDIGVLTDIENYEGHVRIHGELWSAETKSQLNKGDQVRIIGINGLVLNVQKAEQDFRKSGSLSCPV